MKRQFFVTSIALVICIFLSCEQELVIVPYDTIVNREYVFCKSFLRSYGLFQSAIPVDAKSFASPESLYNQVRDPYTFYLKRSNAFSFTDAMTTTDTATGVVADTIAGSWMVFDVVSGSSGALVGVAVFDTIRLINDRNVELIPFDSVSLLVTGDSRDSVRISVKRGLSQFHFLLRRQPYKNRSVFWSRVDTSCSYISLNAFLPQTVGTNGTAAELQQALDSSKRSTNIILDVRDNGIASVREVLAVANKLSPAGGALVRLTKRLWDTSNHTGRQIDTVLRAAQGSQILNKKLYVLCSGTTAAGAEMLLACCDQNSAAMSIGSRTFGDGRLQMLCRTPDSAFASVTNGIVRTVSQVSFDSGVGIVPGVLLDSTADALKEAVKMIIGISSGCEASINNARIERINRLRRFYKKNYTNPLLYSTINDSH
ncbi:MAG: hypothetical protein JW795_00145 [Chitinivibrionales bacterium]|nr:hypothetical protein [Chitinivibrionales bacterium]